MSTTLPSLPEDELYEVLLFVDVRTVGLAVQVCRQFRLPSRRALQHMWQLHDVEMTSLVRVLRCSGSTDAVHSAVTSLPPNIPNHVRLAAIVLPPSGLLQTHSADLVADNVGPLRHIRLNNFLYCRHAELALRSCSTCITGYDDARRSSMLAAVVFAFAPDRLRECRFLVRDGASQGTIRLLLMLPVLEGVLRPAVLECSFARSPLARESTTLDLQSWTLNGIPISSSFVTWLGQHIGVHDNISSFGQDRCSFRRSYRDPSRMYAALIRCARAEELEADALQVRLSQIREEFHRLLDVFADQLEFNVSLEINERAKELNVNLTGVGRRASADTASFFRHMSAGPMALVWLVLALAARAPNGNASLLILEDPLINMDTSNKALARRLLSASLEHQPCQLLWTDN